MLYLLLSAITLARWCPRALAHERGAPCSALLDISMTPQHGARPQPAPSPFRLAVLNDGNTGELVDDEVKVGQRYKVIIDHSSDVAIKGFIIRAIYEDPKRPDAGEFVDLPECVRLVKWCSSGGNYVTHRHPGGKPGGCASGPLLLRWQAPEEKIEDLRVYFQATVVQDYSHFWTDIVTPSYKLIGDETTTPTPKPTPAATTPRDATPPRNGNPLLQQQQRNTPQTRPPPPRVTTTQTFPPTTTLKPITPPDFDPSCGIEDGPDCLERLRVDFKRGFCEIEGWPDYCPQLCCYKVKGEPSPFA